MKVIFLDIDGVLNVEVFITAVVDVCKGLVIFSHNEGFEEGKSEIKDKIFNTLEIE